MQEDLLAWFTNPPITIEQHYKSFHNHHIITIELIHQIIVIHGIRHKQRIQILYMLRQTNRNIKLLSYTYTYIKQLL